MPDLIDNNGGNPKIDNKLTDLDNVLDGLHNPDDTPALPPTNPNPNPSKNLENSEEEEEEEKNNNDDDDDDDDTNNSIKTFENLLAIVKNKDNANLTEAETQRLSDIVDTFGGEGFNEEGAIVDTEGKVLYTAKQVEEYLNTDLLPVDENGNFVDASNNIIKTKAELYREQTTVGVVMNALAKNFDLSFKDDFLPEDTEDSIVNLVIKTTKVLSESAVRNYMEANPELEAFRKHYLLHGSAEGYKTSTVDYDKLDYKTLTKDAKQSIIKEAYNTTGQQLTPSYLKYLDTLSEEDYNTEVQANATVLKKQQELKKEATNKQLQEKEVEEQREAQKYWDTVTNTIKNGKLSNINIPVSERDSFLSYVLTPVSNGKSKDMLDAEKEDVTSDLLMSYLRFKGKDISALARNIAGTQNVQGLRQRMAKNNIRNNSSDKGKLPKTQNDYIPSLSEIKFT